MPEQTDNSPRSDPLPPLAIRLLKGVLYRRDHEELWQSLVNNQSRVRDHFTVLNLRLVLNESEGYAYLRTRDDTDEDQESRLPTLITRQPLSYPVSLLLALLRKRMVEHDAGGGGSRLVLTRDQIWEMARVFWPDSSNEVKAKKRLNENLNKIRQLGFLRRMTTSPSNVESTYEVQRIVKEFVTAEWLATFEKRLGELSTAGASLAENADE